MAKDKRKAIQDKISKLKSFKKNKISTTLSEAIDTEIKLCHHEIESLPKKKIPDRFYLLTGICTYDGHRSEKVITKKKTALEEGLNMENNDVLYVETFVFNYIEGEYDLTKSERYNYDFRVEKYVLEE